jgi:glutamate N-acetyltransferase/amino-acid N-acetyltransferase
MKHINGGAAAPLGFKCGGAHAGIKRKRNDIALIVSDVDATAAGVFTQSIVRAHCVIANEKRIKSGVARAIVCNSGNANACNGEEGRLADEKMADVTASLIGCDSSKVLTASTGVIGTEFPVDKVQKGIEASWSVLSDESSPETDCA